MTRRWFALPSWSDERGQFAGIEAIPFGILIFILGSLLVANAWAVVDAKMAVTSAAREAARTYVEAPPDLAVAAASGREAARDALASQGRDPDHAVIAIDNPAGAFARCARIEASVTYRLPAVSLPILGGYGQGFEVRAIHSEVIDPWRDDLPGSGCA